MSSYTKYKFEEYAEDIQPLKERRIRRVATNKPKKKVNYIKVLVLTIIAIFILKPVATRIYDYTFMNNIRNSKIKVDADKLVNQSSLMIANTNFLGRNFIGHVNYKKPVMEQLELNHNMPNLEARIKYLTAQYPNLKPGIFIWDYQTKNYVSINGDMQTPAASIIKVPILLQMFKRIELGELDLYEKFNMTSYYRSAGSGYLQYRPEGAEFEMNDLANYMIRTSDNTATNMILSAVGGTEEMNSAIRNWGFSQTYVRTWLPDLYGTNVTTPKDMATILYNADNPKFLTLENRSRIVEIMSKVKNTSLLKQGIPDSALLIHKTGDIGEMLGDVGVVTLPNGRRYIITVMVKRRWNDYSARALINSISSTVYNSFATNSL